MKYRWVICEPGGTGLDYDECPTHTPHPRGYLAWHEWAERMAKTHRQVRCRECGLWAIWRRLSERAA